MSDWKINPTPPNATKFGNSIFVEAPISDMELDREYCEITHTPPGGTEIILDWGDVEYPFDGATFLLTGLTAGLHKITASAQYENVNDTMSEETQVTTTILVSPHPATAAPADPLLLPKAPDILDQSPCAARRKWVLLQAQLLPSTIDANGSTYTLKRCKVVRKWQDTEGNDKRTVVAGARTAAALAANPILDNKRNKPPTKGATYRAVGIYANPHATPKREIRRSDESAAVSFP